MSKSFVGKNSNIVTNIIESSSNDLVLKSQNTNLYDVVINDELCVDEIKSNKKDKVLISNLRTNILKFGTDNFYINMIKYFNNCIQIIGSDNQSNKLIIGYNIENDEQKAFINTITLSTKSGDIQCNKLYCQEIQANNLHNHSNLAVLENITSDHLHIHNNLSTLNSLTSSVINNSHSHSNKSYLDSIDQNLSKTNDVEFNNILCNKIDIKPTTYTGESIINFYSKRNGEFT